MYQYQDYKFRVHRCVNEPVCLRLIMCADCITRPDLHPADLIFVRTVNVDPHPADVHRAGHKKFDTLQTITVQTLFS